MYLLTIKKSPTSNDFSSMMMKQQMVVENKYDYTYNIANKIEFIN